jgi:hypothetical protein
MGHLADKGRAASTRTDFLYSKCAAISEIETRASAAVTDRWSKSLAALGKKKKENPPAAQTR